jgi:hypothetical protein
MVMKKLLIILLLGLLTINVSCGGGGSGSSAGGTSLVTITVGDNGQSASLKVEKNTLFAQAKMLLKKFLRSDEAVAAIPSEVYKIVFTISGPGMSTMTKEVLVAGQTSITETFSVPNGNDREFLVEAEDSSNPPIVLYRGKATDVNLDGTPVKLPPIQMEAVVVDTTPPTVISTSPANNETGAAVTSAITITFSESIDTSTFNTDTFSLRNNGSNVEGTITVNGAVVTFIPSANLAYSTTYTATITTGVQDLAGNAMTSDYIWTFTTGTAPDTTSPTVAGVSPGIGATDVSVTSTITATFSELMDSSTINTTTFTLVDGGSPVSGAVTYAGTTATFTPSGNLNYLTSYTATVTTGVKDLAGNAMTADYTWTFTTGMAPDTTPPSVPTGLIATAVSASQINLSWNASTDDVGVAGYKIYDYYGTYLKSVATTSTSFTGLNPNTPYCFSVSAFDAAGNESGQSSQACTATLGAGNISGSVKDALTQNPLQGVSITVYNGPVISTGTSDSNGTYNLTVPAGSGYWIEFSKAGYITVIYYNVLVESNTTTYLETVFMVGVAGTGNVGGRIVNALDGSGVDGLTVNLRVGINTTTGAVVATFTTQNFGLYAFIGLDAGIYTAEASGQGYNTTYFTIVCIGGRTSVNPDATITPILSSGETRIVLTWGLTPPDLDSHLTGPTPEGDRFHVYFSYSDYYYNDLLYVGLDLDDTDSYGPETTTIYQQISGVYRFSVHDYTNRSAGISYASFALSNSGAQVRVYRGSTLLATFNVPTNQEGTLWTVFEMSGDIVTPVNAMSYESIPGNIQRISSKKSFKTDASLIRNLQKKK